MEKTAAGNRWREDAVTARAALDCRGKSVAEAGGAIVAHFNASQDGAEFSARLDAMHAGLRIWLLEAGIRYAVHDSDDGVFIKVRRGAVPAQGSIPGVHHVLSAGDSVWTCERDARVARIDAHSGRVVACAAVAHKASHMALAAGAQHLFVADSAANAIIALHAADLSLLARWAAPGGPQLPVVSAEGIVAVTGPATGTLTIARPSNGSYVEQTLAVGSCPHDPLLAVDQQYVYVPCAGDGFVVKVRLADGAIVGRCAAGDGPSHLVAHPAGTRIYCANSWDGTLSCLSADGVRLAQSFSGGWAHAIDISPDGLWIYVANFLDDTLAVFDAESLQRLRVLSTDPYPHGLDVAADGGTVAVAAFAGGSLRLYDAGAQRERARLSVGAGASHTTFAGGAAFVACSVAGHLAKIDCANAAVTAQISLH